MGGDNGDNVGSGVLDRPTGQPASKPASNCSCSCGQEARLTGAHTSSAPTVPAPLLHLSNKFDGPAMKKQIEAQPSCHVPQLTPQPGGQMDHSICLFCHLPAPHTGRRSAAGWRTGRAHGWARTCPSAAQQGPETPQPQRPSSAVGRKTGGDCRTGGGESGRTMNHPSLSTNPLLPSLRCRAIVGRRCQFMRVHKRGGCRHTCRELPCFKCGGASAKHATAGHAARLLQLIAP